MTAQLYPQNAHSLEESTFVNPDAEYRGTPFWAWNNALHQDQLERQIDAFQEMGFGGFHMHARTGLRTPYLSPRFMEMIRTCVQRAREKKMLAWLYDEDRWPSGYGGGLVTRNTEHRMKYILFTRKPYQGIIRPSPNTAMAVAGREENGMLLARYAILLEDGRLCKAQRLQAGEEAPRGSSEWHAYLESATGVPAYNGQTYVDALSAKAIEEFIRTTYERFYEAVGDSFGTTVPAIFTDEPQHCLKGAFGKPEDEDDLTLPATSDFFDSYRLRFGEDLLDYLPEVVWELPAGAASLTRYRYHEHVTECFANAFAKSLGGWCERKGILLTGHMMEEPTLYSQTRATGEAMRSLAHFQLPGIDMLQDLVEFNTAKQAQSIAHQFDRPGVMSELYGVTGWSFDFVGHKAQGDWQAALGVTVRVPHLSWLSMEGESKRDFPASIGYQSPWYKEYKLIEDHFARLNVVLSRGHPVVRIGVVHPIESYWLCYGPLSQSEDERKRRDKQFAELTDWLLDDLLDFDFLCESLLPTQNAKAESRNLRVGQMGYQVVLVPGMRTIRTSTLDLLESFHEHGGCLVFTGEIPSLVDAEPSDRPLQLAKHAIHTPWERGALSRHLEPFREIECRGEEGKRSSRLLYQLREDGEQRHLFICNTDRQSGTGKTTVQLRGNWHVEQRNTFDGSVEPINASPDSSSTVLELEMPAHGHVLLTLNPRNDDDAAAVPSGGGHPKWVEVACESKSVPVSLSEPNVLLLDQAEWRWNDGDWMPRDEILRIQKTVREGAGLPGWVGTEVQPWTASAAPQPLGQVSLRYRFNSEVAVSNLELALEQPSAWILHLNGRAVATNATGWWVDEAIRRIPLPVIEAGTHELILQRVFDEQTQLEWNYLLGDFGVRVENGETRIIRPVRSLVFGDWTQQGLPFYAGNVTYHIQTALEQAGDLAVEASDFGAPLLSVTLDDQRTGKIAFAPFRCVFKDVPARGHTLDVLAYGNRHNAFGPVHNINPKVLWIGPGAWRSRGEHWTYDYHLKPMGLLSAPRILLGGE